MSLDAIRALIDRALQSARGIVRRGTISATGSDFFLKVEGFFEENFDSAELWQQFGFASVPPSGGEAAIVSPSGDDENAIVIATTDRSSRPTDLSEGESVQYSSGATQSQVRCQTDGTVKLVQGGSSFVEVGGLTDKLLLGSKFDTDFVLVFLSVANTLSTAWLASLKDIAARNAYLDGLAAAFQALFTAAGGAPGGAWLATKGKTE